MPTLNELTINGAVVNGGELPSLPASTEEIALSCRAEWETRIYADLSADWEIASNPAQAGWELNFEAKI